MSEITALLDQAKHCARRALQAKDAAGRERLVAMAQKLMDKAEALTLREQAREAEHTGNER